MGELVRPQYVKEWMLEVEQNVVADNDRMMLFCDKLEQYANEHNDDFLKGYHLFYRGFNKYLNAQLEQGMEVLSNALKYLVSSQAWGMVAHAYNSMGNISDFQGDTSLAIDCYLNGLSLTIEHNAPSMEYNIRSNIANVYIGLGSYENAVAMLQACDRLIDCGLPVPDAPQMAVAANLANCYIHLGMYEKASEQLECLRQFNSESVATIKNLLCAAFEAQLYHATGNTQARDQAIVNLQNLELSSINVFDALHELSNHALLLLDIGKIDEFLALIRLIEKDADSPNVLKQVLELQMKYYKKIGDHANLSKLAWKFYEASELREKERNKIVSHNIITRMRLDEEARKRQEIERSNLLLKQKSEHDALTGMNNRYKLNELAELAFHKAQLNGTPLTVEILDIDCYKEFNDNYGHQAGDDCLVRIAEVIRSMEEYSGIHTARYGGDEFVIIYEEYSLRDVERLAQRLQDSIYNLNIKHKYSNVSDRVSISQGLFHRVPAEANKVWDFLYCADMVLYGVKNRGKNAFHIDTSFDVIPNYNSPQPQ